MGIERFLARRGGFFSARLDALFQSVDDWSRREELPRFEVGTACCNLELGSTQLSSRPGSGLGPNSKVPSKVDVGAEIDFPVVTPRQAEVLVVAGTITWKMAPVLRRVYEQMPEPRRVIAYGACAATGGPYNNYSSLPGIGGLVPVDAWVAGCPPGPEDLRVALNTVLGTSTR